MEPGDSESLEGWTAPLGAGRVELVAALEALAVPRKYWIILEARHNRAAQGQEENLQDGGVAPQ